MTRLDKEMRETAKKPKEKKDPLLKHTGLPAELKIKESFRWVTPKIKDVIPIGKNKVRIRGVAAQSNVISKNKRMYLEKELQKSVNSLIGKPIVVNHDPKRIVGNVEIADWEDNELEYVGIVNKEPYVSILKENDPRMKGVSMDADYLFLKCVQCGEEFFGEEEFKRHMAEVHHIAEGVNAPHGIMHKRLSLVISPEEPGIPTATAELFETHDKCLSRLTETIIKERGYSIRKESNVGISRGSKLMKPKLKLGEPFADYADFDDCVAKNQDKGDPAAYCADIKRKTEGETQEQEEQPEEIPQCGEGEVYNPDTKQCEKVEYAKAAEMIQNLSNTFLKGTKPQLRYKYHYVLVAADRKLTELKERKDSELGAMATMLSDFNRRLEVLEKATNPTLKETAETKTLVERNAKRLTDLENHISQIRGVFKGHSKPLHSTSSEPSSRPDKIMRETAKSRRQ